MERLVDLLGEVFKHILTVDMRGGYCSTFALYALLDRTTLSYRAILRLLYTHSFFLHSLIHSLTRSFEMTILRTIITSLPLLAGVNGHLSMWSTSMFGLDPTNINSDNASQPLQDYTFNQWWWHGALDLPPADGEVFELKPNSTVEVMISSNKGHTPLGHGWYDENPREGTSLPSSRTLSPANPPPQHRTHGPTPTAGATCTRLPALMSRGPHSQSRTNPLPTLSCRRTSSSSR